jgi:hypothetical protein
MFTQNLVKNDVFGLNDGRENHTYRQGGDLISLQFSIRKESIMTGSDLKMEAELISQV